MIPDPRPPASFAMLAGLLASGLLLLALPSALGGSIDHPEIDDPGGDGAAGGRDIVAVWFDLTTHGNERSLNVSMKLAEPFQGNVWLFEQWAVWFKPTAGTPAGRPYAYVSFWGNSVATTPTMNAMLGFVQEAGTFQHRQGEARFPARVDGTRLQANISMASFPGFQIGLDAFTSPTARVIREASQSGGEPPEAPRVVVATYDSAPNAGVGRDFKPSGTYADTNFTVTAPSSPIDVTAGQSTSVPVVVHNAGASELNVSLAAYPPDDLNLTIDPPRLALAAMTNGTVELRVAPAEGSSGTAVVGMTASAPDRTTRVFSVTFEIRTEPEGGENATASTAPNASGATSGKTPSMGVPALIIGCILVAAIRRRT